MDSSGAPHKEEEAGTSLPDQCLNRAIACTAIVSKAMNVLGTLATIWATVVLLGGFSVLIKEQDFWYVTIVAFVESIGILGGYEDPTQQLLLRAPEVLVKSKEAAEQERHISWWRRRRINQEVHHQSGGGRRARLKVGKHDDGRKRDLCSVDSLLGAAIFTALRLAQVAAVATCIVLSLRRLKKQDYVDPQHIGAEDHRNIRRSLNIFYWLVFTQGILFIFLRGNPMILAVKFFTRLNYRLFWQSGRNIVNRYWGDNYLEVITGNWRASLKMNLITFAKQLAVSNITVDDQLLGIRAMDRILRSVEYSSLALTRLRASLDTDTLGKLINMLGPVRTPDEEDMRGHASRVLLKLAPDILLDTFPQAMYLISSSLLKTSRSSNMDMDLVWFGLRILDKLTDIQQNCGQTKDLIDLLPKIIDLANLNLCSRIMISDSWIEQEIIPLLQREEDIPPTSIRKIDQEIIVGMSLKILSKLLATPGNAGKKLREEASSNIHLLTDTGLISEHVGAARVIACLALDEKERKKIGRSPEIIKKLKECLLSREAHADITKVAAKLLLLEYTNSEQLSQIKSSIQEKNIILREEDESFSVPTTAFIEALDLDQPLPPWMQTAVRNLDLEDVLSAEQANHCEAAAKALAVLTSGCEENAVAVLQEITVEEMKMIVEMLFPEESRRSRMLARLQPETSRVVKKIICAEEEDRGRTTSVNAKLLQNLRAHGGTHNFIEHMQEIDQALPRVLKAVVDQVAKLEQTGSTNENLANDAGLWVEGGKVFECFIGLAVQICYCQLDAGGFAKALVEANLTVNTFVLKLNKILELYKYPTTDFPSIRRATLELMTWMVGNNSKYRETILQCGVYEQLKEVAKTAGVGSDHMPPISSLVRNLRAQLELCPDFQERYGADARTITVLLA